RWRQGRRPEGLSSWTTTRPARRRGATRSRARVRVTSAEGILGRQTELSMADGKASLIISELQYDPCRLELVLERSSKSRTKRLTGAYKSFEREYSPSPAGPLGYTSNRHRQTPGKGNNQ